MKHIPVFFVSLLMALSVYAFPPGEVTLIINGNKGLQLTVDNSNYNLTRVTTTGNKTMVALTNLSLGSHSLQVIRTNQLLKRQNNINVMFNLREGYNMMITVNGNGSLELIETPKTSMADGQIPMNTTDFNKLLKNVRLQKSASSRRSVIANAINNSTNYFTSFQTVQLLQLVNAESFRLQLAKLSYQHITDTENFGQLYDLLNTAASRNELEDYVNNYTTESDTHETMTDANFNSLYQGIRNQWPVSTQMNSLSQAFSNSTSYFSSYQASQLIQLVSAEANRLQLAKASYHTITDPTNFTQIYNLLNSQASRNELSAYVNNYGIATNPETAMSDENFNVLYKNIQQQWPITAQTNSLTDAFNSPNNYFSTYQARQLIKLITDENNRLQLAKLSYRTVVDHDNFSQLYDVLNSQSSRDELANYVNNYYGYNSQGMTNADFNTLYQTIKQQWPVSSQMSSLTNAFNGNNKFSSYQAAQLIQLVSDEANRLQLAKLSYRSIVDRQNFNLVFDILNMQQSKNELTAYLNSNGDISPNIAMSDANFLALYQTIQAQYFPGEKMNSLVNVFVKPGNYFSSAQAKQLVQMVSSETNRLQLAKSSYRTVVDRNNFNQLYDLFNSAANRNELDAYVKAYKD
jgi:uncharacterized protein YktA (UPF0223 family)